MVPGANGDAIGLVVNQAELGRGGVGGPGVPGRGNPQYGINRTGEEARQRAIGGRGACQGSTVVNERVVLGYQCTVGPQSGQV